MVHSLSDHTHNKGSVLIIKLIPTVIFEKIKGLNDHTYSKHYKGSLLIIKVNDNSHIARLLRTVYFLLNPLNKLWVLNYRWAMEVFNTYILPKIGNAVPIWGTYF